MDETIEAAPPVVPFLTDLRELVCDQSPDSPTRLRIGTDRVIIAAMGRVQTTAAARMAGAEAARACRSLAMDLQQSEQLHNAATDDALVDARGAAIEALDRFETELASCPPPANIGKLRRRVEVRSYSVVMKKRRPMFAQREPAKAEG